MDRTKTPVALFTYNRPEHTRLVLETLINCARLDECSVRIYCDGARSQEHLIGVEASRRTVREYASRLSATVIERDENLGLSRSIVTGVTELCREAGRVIVIEDDFTLGTDFLNYMLTALDRYEAEPNVYQISGFMYPVEPPPGQDAFFLPLTTTWGWATWERAWTIFDWEASDATQSLADERIRARFDLDGRYPYASMLEDKLAGLNNSWGILWWWSVFKASGLVLYPRRSLVSVGGFDGSGTHCPDDGSPYQDSGVNALEFMSAENLVLPRNVTSDEATFERVKLFLGQQQQQQESQRTVGARLRNRIKRFFQAQSV